MCFIRRLPARGGRGQTLLTEHKDMRVCAAAVPAYDGACRPYRCLALRRATEDPWFNIPLPPVGSIASQKIVLFW